MGTSRFFGALSMAMLAAPALAGDFDGSRPLLCAVNDIQECVADVPCQEVSAEAVGAPRFLVVDATAKQITSVGGDDPRVSPVERMERVDGKLMLQGAEDGIEGVRDGLAWSLAISEETGRMVLTGSGDDVGFVIFGACIPR